MSKFLVSLACFFVLLFATPQTFSAAYAGAAPAHVHQPLSPALAGSTYDWLQFDFDSQHSGNNTRETTINRANVNQLQKLFQVTLAQTADGAPAYLSSVNTAQGVKNLLFVTTRDGRIIALDALTGATVWTKQYGPGSCKINQGATTCYTTSSPVVDPNRQYVYSYGLDGYVHKYQVGNGTEIKTGGFPELTTRKAFDEKGSSALSMARAKNGATFLYVTNGGYPGDRGDYQGHVTAINLASGVQHVFNALCSNQGNVHFFEQPGKPDCPGVQSAIWARAGVVYSPATDRIYMATGNGNFSPDQYNWGDTVFALRPNATSVNGNPLDSWTPVNYQQLQDNDTDLGSTAPAILPAPANSVYQHIAVQSGKDGNLQLLDLDNLSHQGGPGHTGGQIGTVAVPQGGEVLTQPAVWVSPQDKSTWVFVANGNGISALVLIVDSNGKPSLQRQWQNGNGGTSPIIANNVLYYVGSGAIWALGPHGKLLWHDSTWVGGIHWESPIVVNGVLYVTDNNRHLTAFSLNGAPPAQP